MAIAQERHCFRAATPLLAAAARRPPQLWPIVEGHGAAARRRVDTTAAAAVAAAAANKAKALEAESWTLRLVEKSWTALAAS